MSELLNRQQLISNLGRSFEEYRIARGLSQDKMSKSLGMSQSSYNRFISNQTDSNVLEALYKFCKMTNQNMGEAIKDPSPNTELDIMFKQLPEFRQRTIRTMIEMDSKLRMIDTYDDEEYVDCYTLTNDNRDGMLYDSAVYEPVNITGYGKICPDTIDCAFKFASNHLHPVVHDGDIVLIHQGPPRNGDTGIFVNRKTRRVYFRRFIQGDICKLEPITPYGKTIKVDSHDVNDMSQWIKFGYVMTRLR